MDLDKVNRWLTLVGNLGVIIGIIFLAIELQNNTKATEAQTRNAMTQNLVSWQMAIGTDEFTAHIWNLGRQQADQLTSDEVAAFEQLIQSVFRNWENEFYQYQMGLYSEAEFRPRLIRIERAMRFCGFRSVWGEGAVYSDDLRKVINDIIQSADFEECAYP